MDRRGAAPPPPHLDCSSGGNEELQIINLGLPKGWKREENIRQSGLSAGRVDVSQLNYYYSSIIFIIQIYPININSNRVTNIIYTKLRISELTGVLH